MVWGPGGTQVERNGADSLGNGIAAEHGLALPTGDIGGWVVGEDAAGAVERGREVDFRQPLFVLGDDGGVLRPAGEIGPFVRVGLQVVEFLAAIGVADVAPTLAADAVVALIVAGDGRTVAFGGGILKLWREA